MRRVVEAGIRDFKGSGSDKVEKVDLDRLMYDLRDCVKKFLQDNPIYYFSFDFGVDKGTVPYAWCSFKVEESQYKGKYKKVDSNVLKKAVKPIVKKDCKLEVVWGYSGFSKDREYEIRITPIVKESVMEIERGKKQNLILEGLQQVKIDESRVTDKELKKFVKSFGVNYTHVSDQLFSRKKKKKIKDSVDYAKEQFLKDLDGHSLEFSVDFWVDKDTFWKDDYVYSYYVWAVVKDSESEETKKYLKSKGFDFTKTGAFGKKYIK